MTNDNFTVWDHNLLYSHSVSKWPVTVQTLITDFPPFLNIKLKMSNWSLGEPGGLNVPSTVLKNLVFEKIRGNWIYLDMFPSSAIRERVEGTDAVCIRASGALDIIQLSLFPSRLSQPSPWKHLHITLSGLGHIAALRWDPIHVTATKPKLHLVT